MRLTWNKINRENNLIIVIAVLVILFAILLSFPNITNPIKNIMNKEKVYSVEVIKISGCEDCFDLEQLKNSILTDNIKIKNEKELDYNSVEGKKIIDKYNLERTPALVIISRNIEKIDLDKTIFQVEKSYAIFDKSVPYIDLNSGKIIGLVNVKEIQDSNCKDCISLSKLKDQLESLGIKIDNYEVIGVNSIQGKELIEENNLSFVPSLLISKEIEEYWWVFSQIKSSLIKNKDYYSFKMPIPPYKEISTGKIKGIVDITYLTNKSCEDCFNATLLKKGFQEMEVYINKEKWVDISSEEGKILLSRYNITAIPTVILSKEILDYNIEDVLNQVGSIEDNKEFVFRNLDVLNVKYQKLK